MANRRSASGRNLVIRNKKMDESTLRHCDDATLLGLLETELRRLDLAWEGNMSIAEREYSTHWVLEICKELRQRNQQQTLDFLGAMRPAEPEA